MTKRKRRKGKGKIVHYAGKTFKCRLKRGRLACKLVCKTRKKRRKK